jgi:hypothetical protein
MISPNLENIPPELKALLQWVCWRADKTPVNPKTGGNAMADDPATWGTFAQAVRYWQARQDKGIAGIGFEFSGADPFTGVDLDKCRDPETGETESWAKDIITRLNSYAEVSPSGRGVHILVKGKLPPGPRRKVVEALNGGGVKVLVATGQLIGEGFDCRKLSTLFLTTPIKFNGRLLQYLGRVLRPAPGKGKARVYDYLDIQVGVLENAARARARVYGE